MFYCEISFYLLEFKLQKERKHSESHNYTHYCHTDTHTIVTQTHTMVTQTHPLLSHGHTLLSHRHTLLSHRHTHYCHTDTHTIVTQTHTMVTQTHPLLSHGHTHTCIIDTLSINVLLNFKTTRTWFLILQYLCLHLSSMIMSCFKSIRLITLYYVMFAH